MQEELLSRLLDVWLDDYEVAEPSAEPSSEPCEPSTEPSDEPSSEPTDEVDDTGVEIEPKRRFALNPCPFLRQMLPIWLSVCLLG